jgi:hypothetical protein
LCYFHTELKNTKVKNGKRRGRPLSASHKRAEKRKPELAAAGCDEGYVSPFDIKREPLYIDENGQPGEETASKK